MYQVQACILQPPAVGIEFQPSHYYKQTLGKFTETIQWKSSHAIQKHHLPPQANQLVLPACWDLYLSGFSP